MQIISANDTLHYISAFWWN